jgi:hypothetical protein
MVQLVVEVPDYGPGFVGRVVSRLQEAADARWPAAGIKVHPLAKATKQ